MTEIATDQFTVFIAILGIILTSLIAFGAHAHSAGTKFQGKSSIDELNAIRLYIRSDTTPKSLDKLWSFFKETSKEMESEGMGLDICSLYFDVSRNKRFNQIINEVESTFTESQNIKEIWLNIGEQYKKLGYLLITLALYVGMFGFSLIYYYIQEEALISYNSLNSLSVAYILSCFLFLLAIVYYRELVMSKIKIYHDAKHKYLVEVVRV